MRLVSLLAVLLLAQGAFAQTLPAIGNWSYWEREPGKGSAQADPAAARGDSPAFRVEYRGSRDWAFFPGQDLAVKPGDIVEFTVDMKADISPGAPAGGDAGPCLTTYTKPGEAAEWMVNHRPVGNTGEWQTLRSRAVVAENVTILQPRIVGNGASRVWIANPRLERKGNIMSMQKGLPGPISIGNAAMRLTFDPAKATFTFEDRRNNATWTQRPQTALLVTAASATATEIQADLLDAATDRPLRLTATLDAARPEVLIKLTGQGEMPGNIAFPGPMQTAKGQYLVIPMNEGISYPVEDPDMPQWSLVTYGGHGICMPFFGATDGERGWMAIYQTADDSALQLSRSGDLNYAGPTWESQRGQFGYTRELRYVLIEKGGHVAMAKRYRQYAKDTGLLKTLAEKRKTRPKIDMLMGAANIWCWDDKAPQMAREMLDAGIDRMLWSNARPAEELKALNDMGVLTSRYDIYQDLMDPANFPKLQYKHPDWTTEGFPKDIILNKSGKPIPGWEIEVKGTKEMIPCAVLCDLKAPDYARKRIGEELLAKPYQCRFIDTTTASPWRECYSPDHPMTRTQSREAKMKLLSVVSDEFGLVCGSETGHDAAVPYADYFEGMLSLGPYRLEDAGRAMQRIEMNVPEKLLKFQVGEKYRLPLWELVYHDACVAQWYWGDYNNKLPPIWHKRDLFNALYGTPPMFMFNRKLWNEQKAQFVESYKVSAPITRATAYQEMTDHRFLAPDRSVQQTTFANGIKVIVNFGEKPFPMPSGQPLAPGAVVMEGAK